MDQIEDPDELEREIERASRLASAVSDQTTYQRLRQFVEELKQNLQAPPGGATVKRSDQGARKRTLGSRWLPARPGLGILVEGRRGIAERRDPLSPTEDVLGKTSGKDAPGQPLDGSKQHLAQDRSLQPPFSCDPMVAGIPRLAVAFRRDLAAVAAVPEGRAWIAALLRTRLAAHALFELPNRRSLRRRMMVRSTVLCVPRPLHLASR